MAKGHIVAHRVLCRWFVGAWRLGCLEDITSSNLFFFRLTQSRYEQCWLPMVRKQGWDARWLVAPVDIEFVWASHLLMTPTGYAEVIRKQYDVLYGEPLGNR